MVDIPNGDALILQFFTYFFDIGAKPGIARKLELWMSDILVQLVAECNSLPSEVVDIIVAQFLRANPTATIATITGGRKEKGGGEGGGGGKQTSIREHMAPPPPAYNMARVICTSLSCVDKMARHICQYFSEVILDASPSSRPSHHYHRRSSLSPDPHSSPDPAGPHEPTDDDLKELSKAHLLVKELWRAAPSVLQNVIPQLEQELLAENVQLRLLATETIGEMSAISPSPPLTSGLMGGPAVGTWGGSFANTCPVSWRLWLGRVNDKSWLVRSKWVECATKVLQTLSPNTATGQNAAQALIPLIADKLNDTDERVRLATCRFIGEDLDYASVKLKLNKSNGGEKLLENLALRAKDKKHSVRVEGMRVLARMWDEGYEDIRRGEEAVVKLLGWIPGRLLETSYVNDKDVNVLLDRVMWEVLLPLEYPPGCLESGKKKPVAANGKGKSGVKANGKGKEKEAAKKSATFTTRTLREKKPQNKQKDTLDFSDSDEELSDAPESDEDGGGESDQESESEPEGEEAEVDENQQPLASQNSAILSHDHNRTIRLLHLAHNLSPRSLRALLALASRQVSYSAVLTPFLDAAKNFGTTSHTLSTTTTGDSLPPPSQADSKARLTKLIDYLANQFPDPARSREHLWKWVKLADRRGWSLVRGMLSVDAGWTQVVANLKEVVKRIEKAPGGGGGILETVLPLLYRSALLLWNKSHVPTIVAMSKEAAAGAGQKTPDQDLFGGEAGGGAIDNGLAITANLLLKEMSNHIPAVFKAHIASLCTIIQECAPPIPGTKKAASAALEKLVPIDPSIVDTLSALSTFAKKYPQDVPQERKLHQALFALATSPLSTPHAAKHAVRVLMSAAMDRKEMYASDLVQRCITEWAFGGEGFIVRLGAMAEMVLVAPQAVMGEKPVISRIKQICVKECITKVREHGEGRSDPEWEGESLLSNEGKAKIFAVKALVNMLRANPNSADLTSSIMETLLRKILVEKGEISPSPETAPTPKSHRAHLRLVAANSILKLAAQSGRLDELVSPELFNIVALTAQDSRVYVRLGFLGRLKKLLAAGKLGPRWYAIVFLVAHDPEVREETSVWIRARAKAIASAPASVSAGGGKKVVAGANIMELVLARLISLLAHHPDFPADPKASSDELLDMAKYLVYYIRAVVTAENIGVVWYIAGYIKRVQDGIDAGESERLYILSELTQALCRRWKEMNEGWVIETWPGKIALPKGLFKQFDGGEGTEWEKKERVDKKSKEVSMRIYLPGEVDGKVLDGLLKEKKGRGEKALANGDAGQAHGRKRKSDGGVGAVAAGATKKRRQSKGVVVEEDEDREEEGEEGKKRKGKTPRKKRASLGESEGVGATPKTPKRTPKKRRKSGGGNDDDEDVDDTRDVDADDAGMSTVERRRSGRVVSKVVYAEDEEEEETGEELEEDDSDGESGEESGDGSGEDEDGDDGGADKMDIDGPDSDPELEPKTRRNTRGSDAKQRGKIIPKATTKKSKNTASRSTRGSKKRKENGDLEGDKAMSDVSELTQFESEVEVDEEEEVQDDEAKEPEQEQEGDVDEDDTGKEQTLEEALSRSTPKAKMKTKTPLGRGRGRGGGVNGSGSNNASEVEMVEAEAQKSPVKQMVVGRVTRRGAAAGR